MLEGRRAIGEVHRQQAWEERFVLHEAFKHRLPHVVAAEGYPVGGVAARVVPCPRSDRLLEEGDACLVPQVASEEERRVAGCGDNRPGQNQRSVVIACGTARRHLQVHLERRRRRFHHDVTVHCEKVLAAADVYRNCTTVARPHDLLVEGMVPVEGRHVREAEIGFADGGQDADHHERGVEVVSDVDAVAPCCFELPLQPQQRAGNERLRCAVQLDVEPGELRHHEGIGKGGEIGFVDRRREQAVVDQPGFQLEPDDVGRLGYRARAHPFREKLRLLGKMRPKAGECRSIEAEGFDLLSHGER